jgi:hypothetical protein
MQYKKPALIITGIATVIGVISYLCIQDLFKIEPKDED